MRIRKLFFAVGALGLTMAPGLVLGSVFFSPDGSTDSGAETAALVADDSANGASQGITVHGDWKIRVLEPGGKLVEERRFRNALTDTGTKFLSRALVQQHSLGGLSIVLDGSLITNQPCVHPVIGPSPCTISYVDQNLGFANEGDPPNYRTLIATVEAIEGTNTERVVLRGTATAMADGVVARVRTGLFGCNPSTVTTAECGVTTGGIITGPFTLTDITPMSVVEGHLIQAEVAISFS